MSRYLVFDIETIVDKGLVKQVYDNEDSLTLEQAYDKARDKILEQSGQQSDFFPIPYHVLISVATVQVEEDHRMGAFGCLGVDRFDEKEILERFWQIFEHTQTLVTFNGRGFDLPVLEMRSLKYGLSVPRYFGTEQPRAAYRGHRYTDAYHFDLCDYLSNFGAVYRRGSLDALSKLIGLPGKYTIAGEDVEYLHRQGRLKEINQYCLTDALQTYLLFLRVELLRGKLDRAAYDAVIAAAREELRSRAAGVGADNFLQDFLTRWDAAP